LFPDTGHEIYIKEHIEKKGMHDEDALKREKRQFEYITSVSRVQKSLCNDD
jgi:hypothetical protein